MSTGARWYWFLLQLGAVAAGILGGMRLFELITG